MCTKQKTAQKKNRFKQEIKTKLYGFICSEKVGVLGNSSFLVYFT